MSHNKGSEQMFHFFCREEKQTFLLFNVWIIKKKENASNTGSRISLDWKESTESQVYSLEEQEAQCVASYSNSRGRT